MKSVLCPVEQNQSCTVYTAIAGITVASIAYYLRMVFYQHSQTKLDWLDLDNSPHIPVPPSCHFKMDTIGVCSKCHSFSCPQDKLKSSPSIRLLCYNSFLLCSWLLGLRCI